MAGLDDLFAEIPVKDIASKLGVDEGEVNSAIHTLVPALVGGLQHNVASDDIDSSNLESAVSTQAASGLLDGGVSVDQVDQHEGDKIVANIFGGNDSNQVASALAGGGAGSSGLLKQLLPILAPIVLAYIGKQLTKGGGAAAPAQPQAAGGGGGLGDVLGSILGGGGGGNNALGSILGSVLGGGGGQGGAGGALGDILGGLLGGKK
ncbi:MULTISPECIES: DUF937 domain-containing protein [unclassified Mycobacterium]|uniref:DUF937 domain-containing protein n=1 Tax=unclassified Mycobacterium TaxID=2642494 RepID=UPI0029C989BE|nr:MULTISPECIES: DUF937 domain-containing protein [unclassified Mycobacterium]